MKQSKTKQNKPKEKKKTKNEKIKRKIIKIHTTVVAMAYSRSFARKIK